MDVLIRAAGFHPNNIESGYMNGPKLRTFMYQGRQALDRPAGDDALDPNTTAIRRAPRIGR
jgi:hypothetical protein